MKKNRKISGVFQLSSAVFMIIALLWLTISIPFVSAVQQESTNSTTTANGGTSLPGNEEEEASNPFANTTEEKAPGSGISISEEYLHNQHKAGHFFLIARQYHTLENVSTYLAFHGELLVPPPNLS